MAIKIPTTKASYPLNNTQCSAPSRGLKNSGQIKNSPAFCGKPIEIKNKWLIGKIRYLGEDFNSAGQRLISGVTALMTQPFFDLHNKKTDEKTRVVSCARTLGKIISGMLTGVLIRHLCIKATDRFCKTDATEAELVLKGLKTNAEKIINFKPREQWLLPKGYEGKSFREIKKYKGAIGTIAAVVIMIGTNFLIDAPLTTYLTNYFTKKFQAHSEKSAQQPTKGGKL